MSDDDVETAFGEVGHADSLANLIQAFSPADYASPGELYVSGNTAGPAVVVPKGTPGAIPVPMEPRAPERPPQTVYKSPSVPKVAPRTTSSRRSSRGRERRPACNQRTRGSRRTVSRAGPDSSEPHLDDEPPGGRRPLIGGRS